MTDQVSKLSVQVDSRGGRKEVTGLAGDLGNLTNAGERTSAQMSILSRSIRLATTAAAGYAAALSAGNVLGTAVKLEQINSRLAASSENVASVQQFLTQTANETGQAYIALADGFSRLLPLQKGGLLTMTQLEKVTLGLANASTVLGVETNDVNLALKGLTQIVSKGDARTTTEDFNQVFDNLGGVLLEVEKSAGLASGGLKQLVASTDGISGRDILAKLVDGLDAFEGKAAELSGNIEQSFNRTRTVYQQTVDEFAEPINFAAAGGADALTAALEIVKDNADEITVAFQVLGTVAAANLGAGAVGLIGNYASKLNEASVASKAFVQTEIASAAASSKSAAAQVLTAKVAKEAADIRLAATAQQANSIRGFKRLTFVSGELSVAQRAATVAASNLTKAEAAATIATDRLALSQVAATRTAQALAVAQRAANGALALVGGPAGAALLAGGALIYLATRESEAEKSARTLTVALDGLDDAYKRNAQSASNAAAATIETEEANIIALQSKYDGLLATYEKLKNSSGVRARDYATEGVALGKLNEQLEAAKKRLEEFKSANENLADGGALITYSDRLENALQKARRAAASEGKAIREALTDLFPDDEKIAELEKLKTGLENIKDSLSPEEYTRAQRAINEQIQGLGEYKERADKAKEAANQLQSALYAAIPERQREDEFADQYDALEAAFNRGGKEADLYRQAMDALQKQFNDDTAKIQADKVRELNDALSERSATPFAKYSDEITLLNRAISELPDEAGNLADNLQRAFANLDFEIQAELTTVTGADNAALARDFAAKKDALEQFIVERARTEEQADADRVALAQSYGDQVIDINEQIQRRLVDLSGGSAAITFELDVVADTVALDQLLRDREITQDEYATSREAQERTHQEALNELVRSGEATRAQAEQASFQARFAGVLEKYSTEIGAAQEAATAILDVRVNREKRQADEAKNIANADEQTYQEALRAFEANGTEENKIALANAKKKRDISKAEAKKQFEDQKEASIASAKLSAGVAILNALATPPWYVGLAQAGIALYKTRDIIKGIKAQSYSGGGDVSAGGSVGAGGGNTGVAQTNSTQQTTVQPAERIVIVAGTFRTPDEAVAEGSRVMKESYEQGYIFNNPDGTQNFDNVPERVVRLNG